MIVDTLVATKDLTPQEHALAVYVLRNPDYVESHSGRELASAAGVSAATVTRLCQHIGLAGFNEFKVGFVAEWKASNGNVYARLSDPLIGNAEKRATTADCLALMPRFYNRAAYEMARFIELGDFELLCDEVRSRRRIDLYGVGANYGPLDQAAFKLQTLGIWAAALTAINIQALKNDDESSGRLAIITSHTGVNPGMIEIAKDLREIGTLIVSLTPSAKSPLARLSDLHFKTFKTSSLDRLSLLAYPFSLHYFFDLLYTALLSPEIEKAFQQTASEYYATSRS